MGFRRCVLALIKITIRLHLDPDLRLEFQVIEAKSLTVSECVRTPY
jgi:hypothetical protein